MCRDKKTLSQFIKVELILYLKFVFSQLIGFLVLIFGMCFYTNLFIPILTEKLRGILNRRHNPDEERIIKSEEDEESH